MNINTEDLMFRDEFGAVVISGADYKSQLAMFIDNPEVRSLSFTLPSA